MVKLADRIWRPVKTESRMEAAVGIVAALGIYMKQFYLFSSGSLQIGDILLFGAAILSAAKNGFRLLKIDAPFFAYALMAIAINTLYGIGYGAGIFSASVFMVFNAALVLLLFRPMLESRFFLDTMMLALKAALLTQFLFYFTGLGSWFSVRYEGTFNDPNQYAFYVLSSFFCVFIISKALGKRLSPVWIAVVTFEIIISASSGMMLSLGIFIISFLLGFGGTEGITPKKLMLLVIYIVAAVALYLLLPAIVNLLTNSRVAMFRRIVRRLNDTSSSGGGIVYNFMDDRGLMRVVKKPVYFLFGCGEGLWSRFIPISREHNEIHSTVISLAYCYGIIPYSTLIWWVKRNVSRLRLELIFPYIALFVEALTLVNHRQPLFWFILVLAAHPMCKRAERQGQRKGADLIDR